MSPRRLLGWIARLAPERDDLRENWREYLAAILSGLILRLAFPTTDLSFVAWFGMVPLLWALRGRTGKAAFYRGWAFGFAFYYSIAFFLNSLVVFVPIVVLGVVLGGLFQGLYAAFFALGVGPLRRRFPRLSLLLIPAWWCALEWLRSSGEIGFPFGALAHSQWRAGTTGIVAIAGVAGLSYLIVLANETLARALFPGAANGRAGRALRLVPAVAACIALALTAPRFLVKEAHGGGRLNVLAIQPNIPQMDKWNSYQAETRAEAFAAWDRITSKTIALTDRAMARIDSAIAQGAIPSDRRPQLIVWPETAVPDFTFNYNQRYLEWIMAKVGQWNTPLLMGASRVTAGPGGQVKEDYVSAYLFEPGAGMPSQYYDKIHLVPFGEDFSYFRYLPFMNVFGLGLGTYDRGEEVTIFQAPWDTRENPGTEQPADAFAFSTMICFESTMPYLSRRAVERGADFLTVITNDAWYGASSGGPQHTIQSVFRAVETQRWLVRCANTGISCFISPRGRIEPAYDLLDESTPSILTTRLNTEAAILGSVALGRDDVSPYVAVGHYFPWLCLLLSATALAWSAAPRSRSAAAPATE